MTKALDDSWIMKGLPVSAVFGESHERPRRLLSQYVRSAYALEYNPWTSMQEIEDAMLYRGVIVSAFAQIETRLGEIAIRCSLIPHYHALRERFPFKTDKRVAFLRRVFELEPMARHRLIALAFLDRFESIAALRHMMAHGRMQVLGGQITFHDIPRSDGSAITLRRQSFVFAGLEVLAWRSAKLARLGHKLASRLELLRILPPLENAG
jgi:hypothetical protein